MSPSSWWGVAAKGPRTLVEVEICRYEVPRREDLRVQGLGLLCVGFGVVVFGV